MSRTRSESPDRRGATGPIAQAVGLAVIAILPPFLTGAMAVRIRTELGFGPAALGIAVAWFFLVSSTCSTFLGAVVERLGTRRSLIIGALASSVTLTGLALVPSYPFLLLVFVAGGFANAITQPAVGKSLSSQIPPERLGFAFGIKQSAIPAATLIGGLLVPTVAVALGWRGTFGVMGAIAFSFAWLAWRSADRERPATRTRAKTRARDMLEFRSLVILSAGGAIGTAASTSLGGFLVDSGVEAGIAEGNAGYLMAAASVIGLASRIVLGWYMDLRPTRSRYGWISGLLFVGVPGYLLLSVGAAPAYVAGAALAYGGGWAWAGLLHYAAVSQNPATPAAATGVVQVGSSLGGALGPLSFGLIAERWGYDIAWRSAAALSLLSGIAFLVGRSHLRRVRRSTSVAHLR
jgi:MFS family permease